MPAIAVVTTVATEEEALLIARELVARRLAACVNIVPGVRSVYRWQGEIQTDSEILLVIKSRREAFEDLAAAIRELHSYELPEILSFAVDQGDASYLAWIESALGRTSAPDSAGPEVSDPKVSD